MEVKRKVDRILWSVFVLCACVSHLCMGQTFDMASWGIVPGGRNLSAKMVKALEEIRGKVSEDSVVIRFREGRYDFYPEDAAEKMYYISNHAEYRGNQLPLERPLPVAVALEDFKSLTIEGNGALFVCHGCMLPVSLVRSENCTLQNFSIDFQETSFPLIQILENEAGAGITFKVLSDLDYRVTADSIFESRAKLQEAIRPFYATAYDPQTKRVASNIGDVDFPNRSLLPLGERVVRAPHWNDKRLRPGLVLLLRTWDRPAPGIFVHNDMNTTLKNIRIHYAEGMGVLAQVCENVRLDGLKVCFNPTDSSRYITTIVDATHFSHCRGKIVSANGFYEHMGDDAINVHGIYLDVQERVDDHTVVGKFMYEQTYGFDWGFAGDTVQFVSKVTSEPIGVPNRIARIEPLDESAPAAGMRSFKIAFENTLLRQVDGAGTCSMENLTWTPEVYFVNNVVRDNRARGALFTTPRKVVVRSNVFDHVSGSAILISGDCSYWYESGACRDVLISDNKFIQALTSLYMESNAVISISPVVKELRKQVRCFHGGRPDAIRIVNNLFELADVPVLYVKSVDGLLFKDNVIRTNPESVPFHWNRSRFCLEHTGVVNIVE